MEAVSSLFPHLLQTSVITNRSNHLAKDYGLQEEAYYNCHGGDHITKDCKEPERQREQLLQLANQAIWFATVPMQMSRSAILVENIDTFRKTIPK